MASASNKKTAPETPVVKKTKPDDTLTLSRPSEATKQEDRKPDVKKEGKFTVITY